MKEPFGGTPFSSMTSVTSVVSTILSRTRHTIETSTALPHWTSADLTATVTNPSGAVTFPAPCPHSGAEPYYRAVWQ